ncbi:MAG: UvrB/UvrC motif-containing protein [Candidatus Saccharibacteria bacterium]|nr:UvrB/UvrC motif-containing protein [Candidatus Saccharibacteria bacterium]
MSQDLKTKLEQLPTQAGIYYHLNAKDQIIYVGKASNLRQRVKSYFGHQNTLTLKDRYLRQQITDIRWTLTDNPLQALYLEAEMIKRYQPKYNVTQRNPSYNHWFYAYFSFQTNHPRLLVTRANPNFEVDDCLGPFIEGRTLKRVLKYLRKYFPFSTHQQLPSKACLDYHLGLCPGPETDDFDSKQALLNLGNLRDCLKGQQASLVRKLTKLMHQASDNLEYEKATNLRNQIMALANFRPSLVFSDMAKLNLGSDQAISDLQKLLNLTSTLNRIETYDISHISGQDTAASMIVAINGVIQPHLNRRFKAKVQGNNDVGQIKDVIKRRLESKTLALAKPDLILIDGGKGQVSAVLEALGEVQLIIPVIGLAKKREQIIFKTKTLTLNQDYVDQLQAKISTSAHFTTLDIPLTTHLMKLLQRLRDASHRLALRYHNQLQKQSQLKSSLLDLPGIGQVTYQRLLRKFGSVAKLKKADQIQLSEALNAQQTKIVTDYLNNQR